jgi:hypothetical protein
MRRFSRQSMRWIKAARRLAPLLLLAVGCASVPSYQKYVGPGSEAIPSGLNGESFQALWEERTVHFGREAQGRGGGIFGTGFSALGGQGASAAGFPLDIASTLMDSLLLEAGFDYYSTLLQMNPKEEADFRQAYQRRYDPAEHILIWCRLRTTWAELHLDLDRWTIFIQVQDDELNQYEPVEILKEGQTAFPAMPEMSPESAPEQGPFRRQLHQKSVMLCFPRQDLLSNPVLSQKVKTLKLIFQETDDEKTKAEGTWILRK